MEAMSARIEMLRSQKFLLYKIWMEELFGYEPETLRGCYVDDWNGCYGQKECCQKTVEKLNSALFNLSDEVQCTVHLASIIGKILAESFCCPAA